MALLCACQTKEEGTPQASMKGVFAASVSSDEVVELLPGKSRTLEVRAAAESVSDIFLKLTLQASTDIVDAYNREKGTSFVALPSSAFEFVSNEVMMPRYGKSSTTAKLKVTANGLEDEVMYLLPVTIGKVIGTDNWALAEDPYAYIVVKQAYVAPEAGSGTAADPYNLYTADDLMNVPNQVEEGVKVYFRLMADIDMSGKKWIPINYAEPYKNLVDFNGNGHTISNLSCDAPNYPSFFGVLYGTCYDLNFTGATMLSEASAAVGVVGSYCGTADLPGECHNVHVTASSVTCTGNVRGVGGLFGRVHYGVVTDSSFEGTVTQAGGATGTGGICGWLNGTIERCHVNATVTSNANYTGGIAGYDNAAAGTVTVVKDCYTEGVVNGPQRIGGIFGGLLKEKTEVRNCYSTMDLEASFCIGGIAGHCNLDKGSGVLPSDTQAEYVVDKCIAWNTKILAYADDESAHYSSGAITGYTSQKSFLSDCYRKADLDFTECLSQASNVLYDQPNASPGAPLVKASDTGTYNYPYHGKKADAGATLTSVARSLGWSADVWDFSGDKPVLKSVGGTPAEEDPDVDTEGQLPDFGEHEFYK